MSGRPSTAAVRRDVEGFGCLGRCALEHIGHPGRWLVDRLAVMQPANFAEFEGVVLRIVSTCILAQRFGLAA